MRKRLRKKQQKYRALALLLWLSPDAQARIARVMREFAEGLERIVREGLGAGG